MKSRLFFFIFYRAELSAQKKECMMTKLNQLKENMAATNETLTKAQERINKQEQIRAMVTSMQDKVNKYAEKLNMQKQNSQQLMIVGDCNPDFDFPEPLINYDEEDEKEKQQQQQKKSENLVEGPTFQILKEDDKVAQIPEEPQQVQQSKIFLHETFFYYLLSSKYSICTQSLYLAKMSCFICKI